MVTVREPVLHTVPIAELRPTQITVGMREVLAKQKSWQQQDKNKKAEFLGRHMIPVIRGPKGRLYVIDHHHLSLALHNEGVESVHVTSVADLRNLADDEFWTYIDNRSWVHPYDASGRRRDFDEIPKKISGLKDDPFRSVAGELRRIGGFAKDDFEKALKQAMKLAKSEEASYLPGWCGPHVDHHVNHA